MAERMIQQFVLLPLRRSSAPPELLGLSGSKGPKPRNLRLSVPKVPGTAMKVLDSIPNAGAILVEMFPESASDVRGSQSQFRVVPVVYYHPAIAPKATVTAFCKAGNALKGLTTVRVTVVSRANRCPILGATVVGFADFQNGSGAEGVTDHNGGVDLKVERTEKLERLYIYPKHGHWSLLKRDVALAPRLEFSLLPIDLNYVDALRHFYGRAKDDIGTGVKVGVVDTGVGPHPNLIVEGGANFVLGESASEYSDTSDGHGTHVAGIIAAQRSPPFAFSGLAPGAILRSYRVFGRHTEKSSNFAIAKAIDQAAADGCDLINLSLSGGPADDVLRSAIEDARAAGSVVIAASGNSGRQPVSYPAAESAAIAVSAMGRRGTFPPESTAALEIQRPFGADRKNFIAAFSNVGHEIRFTAPGVDIIATVPGGYAVMSGTSMACPAVTGVAARLLARRPDILRMMRDQARSDAIIKALWKSARLLGFGPTLEGHGLLC